MKVPEGWRETRLSKINKLVTSGSRGWASYYSDTGNPFIRITNLRRDNINPDYSDLKFVKLPNGMNEGTRTALHAEDILISITADLGIIGFIESEPDIPSYINQHIALVRLNNKKAYPKFAAFLLASPYFQTRIKRMNDAGAKAGLNLSTIRSIPLHFPPFPEQKKIAEILSTWDQAIETVEKLIANSQAQKKALMQQLLTGKKRLPGFNGEWDFKRIDQISNRITRRNDGEKYPVLTISSTSGFVRQDEKYSRFMAGESLENYIVLSNGEFAYNKGNSKTYEFGCVFDLEAYPKALVPHVYVCFKLNPGLSHRFYKTLFEADYLRPQLRRLVNTGVRNNGLLNITPKEFLRTIVPVPPAEEQEAIASAMETSTNIIQSLNLSLRNLRSEKSALMQQLLTGKRRVKIEEEKIA